MDIPRNDNDEDRPARKPIDRAKLDALIEQCAALPVLDNRTDDEIIGYDGNGLPS